MEHTLYAANLVPTTTEEQLRAIFEPAGTILEARMIIHAKTQKPTGGALIRIETDTPALELFDRFNGQVIEGRRLALSPSKPEFPLPKTTEEQKDLAQNIATQLGETDSAPCRQILRLLRLCGEGFAQTILAEALEVEAGGGLMVLDGSRRRTQGGVFFYLARGRLSYESQGVIFPRGKIKKKGDQPQQGEQGQKPPKGEKKARGDKGKNKGQPQAAEANAQPAGEVVSAAPPPDLDALRTQLDELRVAHHQAQENLTALQAQKSAKSVGTFSAIKQVFDLQRQIDELLKAYPQLK